MLCLDQTATKTARVRDRRTGADGDEVGFARIENDGELVPDVGEWALGLRWAKDGDHIPVLECNDSWSIA